MISMHPGNSATTADDVVENNNVGTLFARLMDLMKRGAESRAFRITLAVGASVALTAAAYHYWRVYRGKSDDLAGTINNDSPAVDTSTQTPGDPETPKNEKRKKKKRSVTVKPGTKKNN